MKPLGPGVSVVDAAMKGDVGSGGEPCPAPTELLPPFMGTLGRRR